MGRWWLSFCDPRRPEGEQFLGGCIVEAASDLSALREAKAHGCNPGGEVVCVEVPADCASRFDGYMNRLMSRAEIAAMAEAITGGA